MSQEHIFTVMELAIEAQESALGAGAGGFINGKEPGR
jgi:hypothetical protein